MPPHNASIIYLVFHAAFESKTVAGSNLDFFIFSNSTYESFLTYDSFMDFSY